MSNNAASSHIKKEENEDVKDPSLTKTKTDPKLIEQAMLWHQRMAHANYHAVKMMPQHSTGMGVDFTDLNVEDMPRCDACERAGMNPHSLDEA